MTTPIAAGPVDRRVMPLPCPFCGSTQVTTHEGSTFRWVLAECMNCGAMGPEARRQTMGEGDPKAWEAKSEADAIEEWNKRHNGADEAGQTAPR